MKTLISIPTVGGRGTLAGGVELRLNSRAEFVVHNFNNQPDGSKAYHQGSYFNPERDGGAQAAFAEAMNELAGRVERQTRYQGGGEIDLALFTGMVDA